MTVASYGTLWALSVVLVYARNHRIVQNLRRLHLWAKLYAKYLQARRTGSIECGYYDKLSATAEKNCQRPSQSTSISASVGFSGCDPIVLRHVRVGPMLVSEWAIREDKEMRMHSLRRRLDPDAVAKARKAQFLAYKDKRNRPVPARRVQKKRWGHQ